MELLERIRFITNSDYISDLACNRYLTFYQFHEIEEINIDDYANTLPASMGGNKTPFLDEEYLYGDANEDWVVSYHRGLLNGTITPEFREAPKRLRRITINEAIRIQTFPDDYIFCGNKGRIYTQIGNAVPSKLAEVVANATIQYLKEYQ